MALTENGVYLLVTESVSELAANVYTTQSQLDVSFAHDYDVAYANGDADALKAVHTRIAGYGAEILNIDVEEYLKLWAEAVQAIENYWAIPEAFRDAERFET